MNTNNQSSITIRSSIAEYLTFVTAKGESSVETIYANEDIWLTQKMIASLYEVDVRTVNYHLKKIFSDNELDEKAVIQDFRITAKDGKNYNTKQASLGNPRTNSRRSCLQSCRC